MTLPIDPKARKAIPVSSGCFAYFPDALIALAQLSQIANDQHNPGEPLHWAKEKSTDEADALARHQLQHVKGELYDTDRVLHATKVFWRAGAQLQRLLDTGVPTLKPTEVPAPAYMFGHCDAISGLRCCIKMHMHEGDHDFGTLPEIRARGIARICGDCGVDLTEGIHAATCLSAEANRQYW